MISARLNLGTLFVAVDLVRDKNALHSLREQIVSCRHCRYAPMSVTFTRADMYVYATSGVGSLELVTICISRPMGKARPFTLFHSLNNITSHQSFLTNIHDWSIIRNSLLCM